MGEENEKIIPSHVRFMLGGLSGMSGTLFTQPIDMVKNRMQMSAIGGKKEHMSTYKVVSQIIKKEGVLELYNGLSAGLLRQATLTTIRIGVTTTLISYNMKDKETPASLPLRTMCGIFGGIAGSIVGTPSDVAMIRMTSDGRLPPSERRNYKSVFDALYRISKEEGLKKLWVGVVPTVVWGAVANTAQLTTYSIIKGLLLEGDILKDGIPNHFLSSLTSGLVTTVITMPIDITKTRLQNMKTINGVPEYSGMVDVFKKILENEGFTSLWKGFTPYFLRLGSFTVLMLIFFEQYTKLYTIHILGDTSGRRGIF